MYGELDGKSASRVNLLSSPRPYIVARRLSIEDYKRPF